MSSIYFEDNCRSYRNAFRKAIDNPPYIPWISHFLNHTIIPTWKTYIQSWKKTRIRNLLRKKLASPQGRSKTNADLYISELKIKNLEETSQNTKHRSYTERHHTSDPAVNLVKEEQPKIIPVQLSTNDSSTNEETKHTSNEILKNTSNTKPHYVTHKEITLSANQNTKEIQDTGALGRVSHSLSTVTNKDAGTSKLSQSNVYLALGQLGTEGTPIDLTKKIAYRFRTHYKVQHYHSKTNNGASESVTSTKCNSASNQTPSTSNNISKASSTSNGNEEERVPIKSRVSFQNGKTLKELSSLFDKEKKSKEEQHNEENVPEMNQTVSTSSTGENLQERHITGGKSFISILNTGNSEQSESNEIIEISQEYIKEEDTREIYETFPKSSSSQLNILNKNCDNELEAPKESESEASFQILYQQPFTTNEEVKITSESEVSVSSFRENCNRTFSDLSGENSSFENISKEAGTFLRISEGASSLNLIQEEASALEYVIEEAGALEQVSEETGVFQTIPKEASAFKNIPGEDGALQTYSGNTTTFDKISEEGRIVEKFREVAIAFKNLREEILALEKIPEETDAYENILNETDAFDKIRDVTGALEMFFKEAGSYKILSHKDDTFEKIHELANVVKAILEEFGGHKKVSKEAGNNVPNMSVNEVSGDTPEQINGKQANKIHEVPLKPTPSKSSVLSKSSTKSLNYLTNKTINKNTNGKEVKGQCVRFNLSKPNISPKTASKIISRSMSDVRKSSSPSSTLSKVSFKGCHKPPPDEVSKAKPFTRKISKNSTRNADLNKSEGKIETIRDKGSALQVQNKLSKQTTSDTGTNVSCSSDGGRCSKCNESILHLSKEYHLVQNLNCSALNLRDKMRTKIREILLNKYKENCSSNSYEQTLYNFYKIKGEENSGAAEYFDLWKCPLCGCDICIYADLPQSLLLCFQKAANCYTFQSQDNVRTFLRSYNFIDMEKLFTESKK